MKFMLIMQGTQAGCASMSTWPASDFKAHMDFIGRLFMDLATSGELVLAEGLELPKDTKVVTAKRPDAPVVTDGPFPETKEFLAGFLIVDCESLERALEIAAQVSAAPGQGGAPRGVPIEVRRVMSDQAGSDQT